MLLLADQLSRMFSLLGSIGQQFEVRILDALFLNQLRKVYANGVEALSGIDLQVKEGKPKTLISCCNLKL